MAELLILVVIAGVVLLYAAERARKLRARARQMSAMNERLDVAAAKVDEQQERKQARVRASAELTSVLPAIKRPPLTLPGVPGPAAEPGDEPAAMEPDAGPAAEAAPAVADDTPATTGTPAATGTPAVADDLDTPADTPTAADDTPAAADDTTSADNPPAAADGGNTPDGGAGTEESPGAQGAPEGTLTMGRVIPDATPAPKLQVTPEGTLIMPSVPGQEPAPAGEAALPPAPPRPRTGQPGPSQEQASQD